MAAAFISRNGSDFRDISHESLGTSDSLLQVFVEITKSMKNYETSKLQRGTLCAASAVDAIFQIKRKMDEAGILNASIFVPPGKVKKCTAIKSLLFMETFQVRLLPYPVENVLLDWEEEQDSSNDCDSEVSRYLTTLPSIGEVNTIESDLFPSRLFRHGYTLRWGGISAHPALTSLSITYSAKKPDSPLVAKENKRRLCRHLRVDPEAFQLCRVEHGSRIWVYEKEAPEKYDGIVTNTPGVVLAAPGADCMMVLFADPVARACGAVHAGFAGVLAETFKAAINAMELEYKSNPRNILCTIGPCLGSCCADYRKDPTGFHRIHGDIVSWKKGVPYVGLRMAARLQLEGIGLLSSNIDDGMFGRVVTPQLASCTKCDPTRDFFSHRRDGVIFGNCIGFISITSPNQL